MVTINTSISSAVVLSLSRRKAQLLIGGKIEAARIPPGDLDVAVGDRVFFSTKSGEISIDQVSPRKNCLTRSYREKTRDIAANLDRLYLVSSVTPLFQPLFIDRVVAVCESESIPVYLIVNKSDLGLEETADLMRIYERINVPILNTSAKFGRGLDQLERSLAEPGLEVVALAGLSGVGKSSLLNCLVPDAARRTGEVSVRSGRGKQTTSQGVGYRYHLPKEDRNLLIIDLPGVQNFGVSHLSKEQVAAGFLEFGAFSVDCAFDNCGHIADKVCGVRNAVARGDIAQSRYDSYVHMMDEVAGARKY